MSVCSDCPNLFEYPLLSQEWVKLQTSNLAGTFTGSIHTKALKNFWKKGAWASQGTAQIFFEYPLLSQERVKLRTSNFLCTFFLRLKQKPIRPINFGKSSHGHTQRLSTLNNTLDHRTNGLYETPNPNPRHKLSPLVYQVDSPIVR